MPRPCTASDTAERRQRRRALRKLAAKIKSDIASGKLTNHPVCDFPLCEEPRVTDECCYVHSIDGNISAGAFLHNDGIIDWQAIDLVRRGERHVDLTWVEFEIAGAYILMDGETQEELRQRTGVNCRRSGDRIERMKELADALRTAA